MPEADKPFCLCIAGPNGSGKSTLVRALRTLTAVEHWIDPDVVATDLRQLPHYRNLSAIELSQLAFRVARSRRIEYAQSTSSFGFETVYSHPSNLDFLRGLMLIGYNVALYFVCTSDPDINIQRVQNRVALGGHDVPVELIRKRWYKAMDVLVASLPHINRMVLFDNSSEIGESQMDVEILRSENGTSLNLNRDERPLSKWAYGSVLSQFSVYKTDVVPEDILSGAYKSMTDQMTTLDIGDPDSRRDFLDMFQV